MSLNSVYCILDNLTLKNLSTEGIIKPNLFTDAATAIFSDGDINGENVVAEISFNDLDKSRIDKTFLNMLKEIDNTDYVFNKDDISFTYNGVIPYSKIKRVFNVGEV